MNKEKLLRLEKLIRQKNIDHETKTIKLSFTINVVISLIFLSALNWFTIIYNEPGFLNGGFIETSLIICAVFSTLGGKLSIIADSRNNKPYFKRGLYGIFFVLDYQEQEAGVEKNNALKIFKVLFAAITALVIFSIYSEAFDLFYFIIFIDLLLLLFIEFNVVKDYKLLKNKNENNEDIKKINNDIIKEIKKDLKNINDINLTEKLANKYNCFMIINIINSVKESLIVLNNCNSWDDYEIYELTKKSESNKKKIQNL